MQITYDDYMKSTAWVERKRRYYADHPRRCAACDATRGIHLHHLTYVRLGEEPDSDLIPLCKTCHDGVHAHQRATKGSLPVATFEFIHATKKTFVVPGAEIIRVKREPRVRNGSRSRGENPRALRSNPKALDACRTPKTTEDRERWKEAARRLAQG